MIYIHPQFSESSAAHSDTKKKNPKYFYSHYMLVQISDCMLVPIFLHVLLETEEGLFHLTLPANEENQISSQAKKALTIP